jgi:hypothetical protein
MSPERPRRKVEYLHPDWLGIQRIRSSGGSDPVRCLRTLRLPSNCRANQPVPGGSLCSTELSEIRVDWPPLEEISTPFGEHHPIVALLGWAAIGPPHPEGWTSRGQTTPRDAHGTERLLVAAIDVVAAVVLTPIKAITRTIRRNKATPHCGIPSASMAPQGSSRFHD